MSHDTYESNQLGVDPTASQHLGAENEGNMGKIQSC